MEIHLAPEIEAQLQHLASSLGKKAAQVAEETLTLVLRSGKPGEACAQVEEAVRSQSSVRFASPEEKARAFEAWARSHPHTPPLPDEALQRENLVRDPK